MGDLNGSFLSSDKSQELETIPDFIDCSAFEATESEDESTEPNFTDKSSMVEQIDGSVLHENNSTVLSLQNFVDLSDDNDENDPTVLGRKTTKIDETLNMTSGSVDLGAIKRLYHSSSYKQDDFFCPSCSRDRSKPSSVRVKRVILDDSDFTVDEPLPCICFKDEEEDSSNSFVVPDDQVVFEEDEDEEEESASDQTESSDTKSYEEQEDLLYESTVDDSLLSEEDYPNDEIRKIAELKNAKITARNRNKMADDLFSLFNRLVFSDQLPKGIDVQWNKRLLSTAGRFHRSAQQVQLSVKILTSGDRLMNTLLHELCHAAVSLIDKVQTKRSHGAEFNRWGRLAHTKLHGHLKVTTYHNYIVEYKFRFICRGCAAVIQRHSKSIDVDKDQCKKCGDKFFMEVNGLRVVDKQTELSNQMQSLDLG